MSTTPNLGLPLIEESMYADVPRDMNALAMAIDQVAAAGTDTAEILNQLLTLAAKVGNTTDAAGAASVFAQLARNYAAVDTLEADLGTVKTGVGTNGDAPNAPTLFAHLKNTETYAQRIGLSSDTAGPLTLFSRLVSLSNLLGANSDASGTSTAFARFAQIVGLLGSNGDAANGSGSIMARLAQIVTTDAAIKGKTDLIGANTDSAGVTTIFGWLKSLGNSTANLPTYIGDPDETGADPGPGVSIFARLNYLQNQVKALTAARGPNINFNVGSLTQVLTAGGNSNFLLVSDRVRYAYLLQPGSTSIQRLDKTNGSVTVMNAVLPAAPGGYLHGCIVGTKMYLQLGNTKNTFGYLDLTNNQWTVRAYPSGIYTSPDMRICMIDSNTIYAVIGTGVNNEFSMLKYTISTNTWTTLRTQQFSGAHISDMQYYGGDRVYLRNDTVQPNASDVAFSIAANQFLPVVLAAPPDGGTTAINYSELLYAGGPFVYRYTQVGLVRFDLRGVEPVTIMKQNITFVSNALTLGSTDQRWVSFDDGSCVMVGGGQAGAWFYSSPTLTADAIYARR
ncbi:hypothetical protein I8J29_24465 [Paenibacillus sp. MWE-103]|uniref:Uncharacterized protein n=1 Tax=Paenibacillus artemisiicola TaxID=1172618 RepID=A0ABS3WGG4_9BACL|nr:hypothetical protein [Paenibacillus artemisiicola]MBO7747343.1 hypothetical protein [Paenibacillus artemisiicola]